MSNDTKHQLEIINDVSRQLLSRVLAISNQVQENKTNISEPTTDDELTELMVTRQRLIHSLFEKNTHEEISIEIDLLNEMVLLDIELSNQSNECKQALAKQVIKLKKSKKVTKSYQKY